MVRVFLVNASAASRLYGIGNYVDIVFNALSKSTQIHPILVDFNQTNSSEEVWIKDGQNWGKFTCYFKASSLYSLPIKKLLDLIHEHYTITSQDVFHINTPNHLELIRMVKKRYNCKAVYTIHFDTRKLHKDRDDTQKKEKEILKLADRIICLSFDIKTYWSSVINSSKLSLISTGLNPIRNWCKNKKIGFRQKLNIGGEDIVILFNGRIDYQKGFYELLKVFPLLLESFPNIHLIVVGDGNLSEALEKSRKILGRILFTGYVNRKDKAFIKHIYQISDIFVLPSFNEQLSLSFLEAANNSVATIVSDIPSFSRFPNNLVSKVSISNKQTIDQKDLYDKLAILISSKSYRNKLGRSLCSYCRTNFSGKKFQSDLIEIYEKQA
ncbi:MULTISPECIES: glycosyltransferase family 4 protein [unclassified Sphingobacterium]|uniref:glycosyltransferase family 4 protein n=1 Tax=unclassified Sphingobacterium TaxID=2609468 RepID=UPI0025D2E92E|nr:MULTISPECIES: glycosyltransferase family 4 protein [unclassified Sphingobacterium]